MHHRHRPRPGPPTHQPARARPDRPDAALTPALPATPTRPLDNLNAPNRDPTAPAGVIADPRRCRRLAFVDPVHENCVMSYALTTLGHERQRFLPAVLAVAFSALLIALQSGLLLGLLTLMSTPVD